MGLRSNLRRLRVALQPMRERGYGLAVALLLQLPSAVALRAWRRLVRPVNQHVFGWLWNAPRLARFNQTLPSVQQPRLYVVVMPHVLHVLLPCLALLRGHAQLLLVANGASAWEMRQLRDRLPEAPQFVLHGLPGSSIEHGKVVSLLLQHAGGNFGIVDHDFYLFDHRLLTQLEPAADECMVALLADAQPHTTIAVPLTHLLYLNAAPLRELAQRHGVDASLVRRTPASARAAFDRIGLRPGLYFKAYQNFHDTLHVLLGLALDSGLKVRVPDAHAGPHGELPYVHVGGTSIGSHHTKSLFALHVHLRFLALVNDAALTARYGFLTRPLFDASQALLRRRLNDPAWDGLPLIDDLMPRLQRALQGAWPSAHSRPT